MSTWLVVGASRGIGFEFVKQLLARGENVIATARNISKASQLGALAATAGEKACTLLECDVASNTSIESFAKEIGKLSSLKRLDYVILNAGILRYPNRSTEVSFEEFADHLRTNSIGPIITAQKLLQTGIPIGTLLFMSSDSGSVNTFRAHEDGFAIYGTSKAALNHAARHMAVELKRKGVKTIILLMHPGEVITDMSSCISVDWEVEGVMSVEESVSCMLKVIPTKTIEHSGTFWTWLGEEYPW